MSKAQKLSPEEDQRITGISAILTLPIMIGGAFYVVIYLHAITDLIDINQTIMYLFLLVAPVSTGFFLAVYEGLSSRKIDKTFLFHLKRFLSRTIIASGYFFCVVILWTVSNFFLSALISWRYILIMSFFVPSIILAIFAAIPKTRHLINRLTEGE